MAKSSTYQGSATGMRSQLDIFSLPMTDTSVVASNYISFTPISNIKQEYGSVQFVIPPTSAQYIDLKSTFLYIQAKVVQKDGTDLAATDIVSPTNMFFYSMWKNCIVSLNGSIINDGQNVYAYQAALPTLLMDSRGEKESELTSILFYKDTIPETYDVNKNDGFKKRVELSKNSKLFDMAGPIATGLCQQGRYLPTNCSIRIEFVRQAPEFCLDCATDAKAYKFVIEQAVLQVKMHNVSPNVLSKHNQLFAKARAQFPFRDTVVRSNQIPKGSNSFMSESMFVGRMPQVIVVGLLDSDGFNGKLTKNFLNFQPFKLEAITVTCDNETLLYRSLKVDFESNLYMMGYQTIFRAMPIHSSGGNYISRDEYANGNCLFLIDLLPAAIGSSLTATKSGHLKVELKFSQPTADAVNLLVFASSQNLMELDQYRNVYIS